MQNIFMWHQISYHNLKILSVGVDIETGGHVFQLHLTNSRSQIEKDLLPRPMRVGQVVVFILDLM
ncbi:MAG: hypothetical protein IPO92_20455 [Saprospiraceae bacterium]|nr:hypothetical protein [Saprospiraceae bacterium]